MAIHRGVDRDKSLMMRFESVCQPCPEPVPVALELQCTPDVAQPGASPSAVLAAYRSASLRIQAAFCCSPVRRGQDGLSFPARCWALVSYPKLDLRNGPNG
ncbi:hypothetical protein ZHAS_00005317 [Anopheles sinensis]|uniref:Uncharacterized protein n=1 Tax=Anopheles sinensis TaxID=74873 RepID=A0A084VJ70_ANOSI|nr:hypothetical protein ZHAS_00005317 [Anopheles sinensis]